MKKKLLILTVMVNGMLLFLLNSCSSNSVTDGGTSGNVDRNPYLITTDGNANNLSQNLIDAEYNTFLFLPGETRKLYYGGKLPQNYYDYNSVWLENSSIWNPRHAISLYSTDISTVNSNYYYDVLDAPIDIPYFTGDNNVSVHVGNINNDQYTSYASKTVTFRIADYGDRDWNIDVYQQQSYNSTSFSKDAIVKAFKEMNVPVNINVIKSDLDNETVSMDNRITTSYSDNPIIRYVYSKIYPDLSTNIAISKYSVDHPNNGLLFFIKDYNVTGGDSVGLWGRTYAAYANGEAKYPAVSFVFVKKLLDDFAADWENKSIISTAIHELGHLWCVGLTDDPTHTLWHNGDNKKQCVMDKYNCSAGTPDDPTKKIFNFAGFCEGHLQRGMNVSWNLKQYTPWGELTGLNQPMLFASNNSNVISTDTDNNNKFDLYIESGKSEFIMGEVPDVIVRIKNKTNDTLKLYTRQLYIFSYDENRIIEGYRSEGITYTILPPNQQFSYILNPMAFINHKKEGNIPGVPWFYWNEGEYDFYLSYKYEGNTFYSNKIPLIIYPVPDSLKGAFEDLKHDIYEPYPKENYKLFTKYYKGTFYEQQFYYNLLTSPDYWELNNVEQAEYKEFIVKYSNTAFAYSLFNSLFNNYDNNKNLIEDIIKELEKEKPECDLLLVLKAQPDYNYKEIKPLLQRGEE
jgi:hypothetical protein